MAGPFRSQEFSPAPRLLKWAGALAPLILHRATQQVYAELSGYGNGWTDITRDLASAPFRTFRGFQSAMPDDLLAAPGQWTFQLDNSINNSGGVVGYYSTDSVNCRSGYTTNIRIKLVIVCGGIAWTRFVGFLETSTPTPGVYADQTVDVLVVGWLNQAQTASIAGLGVGAGLRPDQLVAMLVALVDKQPVSSTLATGLQTYPYPFDDLDPENGTVTQGIDSTMRSGFDRFYEGPDGGVVLETRRTRQTLAPAVIALSDVAPPGYPSLAITTLPISRSRASQYNGVRVTVHPGAIDASAVVLYALQISASNPSIPPMQSITIDCPYVDPNIPSQQIGGFNMLISNGSGGSMIGTSGPLPTADYQFGTTVFGGGGSDISAFVTVSVVYGANAASISLDNADPSRTAYFWKLQCRGQGVYKYQTVQASVAMAGSQAGQGENFLACDCPYNADPFFAQSAAIDLGGQLSQAISQIEQGISIFVPAEDEASMLRLLALDISSSISITETVSGLAAGLYWINSESMEIDEMGNITFTYGLAPNVGSSRWQLGVVGSGELGVVTDLGF